MLAIRIGLAAISTGLPIMSVICSGYGPGIGVAPVTDSAVGSTAGSDVRVVRGVDSALGVEVEAVVGREVEVGLGAGAVVGELSVGDAVAVGSTLPSLQGPESEHGAMIRINGNARKRDTAQILFRVMMFTLVTRLHRVMVMPVYLLQ